MSYIFELFGHAPVIYEARINNDELIKWFRDAEVNKTDDIEYHIFNMLEDQLVDSGLEADSLSIRVAGSNDDIYNAPEKEPKINIETIDHTPEEESLENCFTVEAVGMWRGVYGTFVVPAKAEDFIPGNLSISINEEGNKLIGIKYNNESIEIDRDKSRMRDKGSYIEIYFYDEVGNKTPLDVHEKYSDYLQTAPESNPVAMNTISGIKNINELMNKIIKLLEESEWSDEKEISSIVNVTDPRDSNSDSSIVEVFDFDAQSNDPLTYLLNKNELVVSTNTDDLGDYIDLESLFKLLAEESSNDFKIATLGWFDDYQRVVYCRKAGTNFEFADLTRDDWADCDYLERLAKDKGYNSIDDESLWEEDEDTGHAPLEDLKDEIYDSLLSDPTLLAPKWFE